MGGGVETSVESGLRIRLLGPLSVQRDGSPVPLPRSRKVRALLGFLALSPGGTGRSKLCDLLWEVPNDPRGELRWCLSRLRSVLGTDEGALITLAADQVALDLSSVGGCFVDALAVDRALQLGASAVETEALAKVCGWFGGELLGGLELEGSAAFQGWLTAQRQRYHTLHSSVLEELVRRSSPGSQETFERLDVWLQIAPFDRVPHELLLDALVQRGRLHDAQDHFSKTVRRFEDEGMDAHLLRETWRVLREGARRTPVPPPARRPSSPPSAAGASAAARRRPVEGAARLIGRDREWAHVSRMWSAARAGRASLLLLTGEAGIGKTRLAEDSMASEEAAGARRRRAPPATSPTGRWRTRRSPTGCGARRWGPCSRGSTRPSSRSSRG